ncbi:ABC transporter permease [Dysgonomonas sp. HGC4]|uniref:ABC transporter permease n=1 Tax=Dysgonomonas sp. HGC4 TaxID=1658009 RepID=UPI0006812CB4|nr:ABC transporter permease [Dysgonomonas sp. HGC4]MBD8346946.1 ABC transporter permease [Dysgonomonas sp. HGC4]
MKSVIKNFYYILKRFKTSSVLNIAGLSVAFTVFIIIAIQSYYDATYNRNFEKANNLEYITIYYEADEREAHNLSVPIGQTIAEAVPEIKNYALVQDWGSQFFDKSVEATSQSVDIEQFAVSGGFLEVFTPEIIAGNAPDMFLGKHKALISQSDALKIFGDEDPIGKIIYHHFSKIPVTIVAVYKDFPKNCSLTNGMYVATQTTDPTEWSFKMYVEIQEGSHEIVKEKLNSDGKIAEIFSGYVNKESGKGVELRSVPLEEAYMIQANNKTTFISLIAIGVIILLIAYINYLNFSIAMAPSRVKSLNIHKILGLNRSALQMSMMFEGIFFALISLCLSVILVNFFASSPLSSFFSASLLISENLFLIGVVGLFLLALIAIVGIYPAKYATSFPEAVALNNSFVLSPRGVYMRNMLILIQFVAAISLCCIAYFIKIQHEYMINYSSGIQKENIVYLPLRGLDTDLNSFGDEMIKNPLVLDYTASEAIPGTVPMGWGRRFEDKQVQFTSWPVTPNFLDFFGVKIIAGNGFTETKKDSTTLEQVIFNNKFIEKYGFDNSLIGKNVFCLSRDGTVKGIAGDINFQSLHYPIEPMAFVVLNGSYREARLNFVFFKISGKDIPSTIEYMSKTWSKFSKEEFKLTFLDQKVNDLYKKEDNMARLIGFFGLITIVIAIMGIYGLIVFNTRYKTKEIAIRKVNGATELEIILMLNKGLLALFLIAFVISVPLAYYAIDRWVESFPYKASIPWWLFLGAAIVVFIISAITVSWQSWKAATANPVKSLKSE